MTLQGTDNSSLITQEGFSLLEAIVAFAVLATVLIVSTEFFGDGIKRARWTLDREHEIGRLQNAMNTLASGISTSKLDSEIVASRNQIQSDQVTIGGLKPVLVRVSIRRGSEEVQSLETILLESPAQ